MIDAGSSAPLTSERVTPGAEKSVPWAAPARVLVADDEPDFRALFAYHLHKLGHMVDFACDGAEALQQLSAAPFDLLLLDLRMPGVHGLDVIRRVRSQAAVADLPIVVVTAHGDPDTAVTCLNLGADDFLEKPIRPAILSRRINTQLLRWQYQRAQAAFLAELQAERDRSNQLLRTLLPDRIADELLATETVQPRRHEQVAVMFADVVAFTEKAERLPLRRVHQALQELFCILESIGERHGVETIKTIGDAYMGAAGLLDDLPDPVGRCAAAALEMARTSNLPEGWRIHAGIDAGPVAAGIVGRVRFRYDIWGDTVNTAARVQSCAPSGTVCLSERAWTQLGARPLGAWRGPFALSGKPGLMVFELSALRPSAPAE